MSNNEYVPLAIDLFAGAGGLAEGLASAGIELALAQELHPQPGLTHAFNHPRTPVLVGDIREIDLETMDSLIKRYHPKRKVDVVVGGPPCQGFSTAGKKNRTDPRNTLFFNFFKVVEFFKPKILVLENVPGFKKMYDGQAFEQASGLFASLGYELQDTILNACDYGVPQRRKRFVMVGVRKGIKFEWPRKSHLNPEENRSLDFFESDLAEPVTVVQALEDIAFVKPGFEAHQHQTKAFYRYQTERRNGCKYLFNHLATRHRDRAVEIFSHIPEGGTINQVPIHIKSAKRTMARLDRNHISNAVLALPDDLIHYDQPRIPSVREMARLQSFDDDYVFIGKRTSGFVERKVDVPQYTQVGNAVPPLLGRAIGVEIVKALGANIIDRRHIEERRKRHKWIRGSSGFAGYTLGPEASVLLFDKVGKQLALPIDASQPRVVDLPSLIEWKVEPARNTKRQWAPGVDIPVKPRRPSATKA